MRLRAAVRSGGFTLLEVMIALAILVAALVVLIRITGADVRATHKAKMLTVATNLARAKMLDIEEQILHDGFPEQTLDECKDFGEEGYPRVEYCYLVEKVELPQIQQLQNEAGDSSGGGGGGSGKEGGVAGLLGSNSLMGGGGGGGTGILAELGPLLPIIEPVLEKAIRRVTLTVKWKVGSEEESFQVQSFFTDTKAIDQALGLNPQGTP